MNEQKSKNATKRIGYKVRVPSMSFADAIQNIKLVSTLGGQEGSMDALSQVTGNSTSSSVFHQKIATLRSFGLITTDSGNYKLTPISMQIAQPDSQAAEQNGVFEALQAHELLNRILQNYKGKILPQKEFLANHIESSYGIPSKLKLGWANYFISAAKFVGILYERESGSFQVFAEPYPYRGSVSDAPQETTVEPQSTQPQTTQIKPMDSIIESSHWGILNQRKVSGNRKAIFAIPDDLSIADIEKIKMILKGIEASLDGLVADKNNELE